MKVYFTAPPRTLRDFGPQIKKIYKLIGGFGYELVSDFIVEVNPDKYYRNSQTEMVKYYQETIAAIKKTDIVVVEETVPSMAMGYVIDKAKDLSKAVVILHLKARQPLFFSAIADDRIQMVEYTLPTLEKVLKPALEYAADKIDTRFNFFISPKIGNYLSWIAKKRKLPRAVYLRRLIEADMEKNSEYSKSE